MDFIFEDTHHEQSQLLQQFNELQQEYIVEYQEDNNDVHVELVDNCTMQYDNELNEIEYDVSRFLKAYKKG